MPSLPTAGESGAPAVQLFVDRARSVVPSFDLGDEGEGLGDSRGRNGSREEQRGSQWNDQHAASIRDATKHSIGIELKL